MEDAGAGRKAVCSAHQASLLLAGLAPSRGSQAKPFPRGLLSAACPEPSSSPVRDGALHPLPPCIWPLQSALAPRCP